ncbi:hybrid sensor histidine kinase/response regulator [Piscinibacter sp. HJYY11]|uniref:hybrid sensor histidine kinase/response regulator n=1 Tax=Piscinibacter sp. HJYY11 TaxID=2801333 RepID=UPI00191D4A28|nr:hybrid sensor histidine kinase/response regulator [Piscinibacter sp. HJYY11]MBL0729637.1 response regulator [Piscinibacter sp. HJYY11]
MVALLERAQPLNVGPLTDRSGLYAVFPGMEVLELTQAAQPVGAVIALRQGSSPLSDAQLHSFKAAAAIFGALIQVLRCGDAQLQRSRRLADFALASGDGFWETDSNHCMRWTALSGISPEAAAYANDPMLEAHLCSEEGDALTPPCRLIDLLVRQQPFSRAVIRAEGGNTPRYLSFSGRPFVDGGSFVGYRGTTRDVTSRVEAEQERRRATRALVRIASQVPGLVCELQTLPDGSSKIVYANGRLEDVFGESVDALRDDPSIALRWVHRDDLARVAASLQHSARSVSPWRGEYRICLPGQAQRVIAGQAIPELQEDSSIIWYVVATDVTLEVEERQRAESLQHERDNAKRLERLRADLTARVSHELRTPLHAILGFAQLLRVSYPNAEIEPGRSLSHVHQAANHLLSVINDMLDLAALEAGHAQMKVNDFELRPLLAGCSAIMQTQLAVKQLTLAIAAPVTPYVSADERSVRQILLNLLSNAVKFSPERGVISLSVRLVSRSTCVQIDVTDSGAGIPPERLDRLFAPFERLTSDRQIPGTGLGLAISRQLARQMGGDLVHIPTSRGSRFRLLLRRGNKTAPTAPTSGFLPMPEASQHAVQWRVLYVDDDPINVLVMEGLLANIGNIAMTAANSIRAGLRAARSMQPDLILLDMHLADGTGMDMLKVLQEDAPDARTPLIAVSADAMPQHIEAALKAGFHGYITKPVELPRLRQTLQRILSTRTPGNHSAQ